MARTLYKVMYVVAAIMLLGPFLFVPLAMFGPVVLRALGLGPEAALDRAVREADVGNLDAAVKWCDKAIRCCPDWIPPYDMRASLRERQGDYRSAVEDYTRVIQLDPAVPDYRIDRGRAYERLGDLDGAVFDYCDAILSDSKGKYTIQAWAEARAGHRGFDTVDEMAKVIKEVAKRHPQDLRLQQALSELSHAEARTW